LQLIAANQRRMSKGNQRDPHHRWFKWENTPKTGKYNALSRMHQTLRFSSLFWGISGVKQEKNIVS